MLRLSAPLLALCGCSVFLGSDNDDGGPTIAVIPGAADFGKVVVGIESAPVVFQIVALEDTDSVAIELDNLAFTVSRETCSGVPLVKGQNCEVAVTFRPGDAGVQSAALQVGDNRADLDGEGLDPGALIAAPATHDYGDVLLGDVAVQTFALTNTGDAEIRGLALTSPAEAFRIDDDNCSPENLAPDGATCDFTVEFTPPAAGSTIGSLSITGTDDGGKVETAISLAGQGVARQHTLAVTVMGDGMVVSTDPDMRINCGENNLPGCTATFDHDTTVVLQASSTVTLWSGDCVQAQGDNTCTLVMDSDKSVGASFSQIVNPGG